ncbi:protocatechuate dioxygenase [Antrihabitans sp. YC2-6]|uniref:protocatechuate dioxygenase n=1 Tax=Antrihabitans sp. YC2-6 TaxID=2799498 RepID=UPI0018F30F21|nr:protocatechuate dioxygenase [Antrihabitans sp. YC2-6]MBJ8346336.1 protocatechuate dioxygenase [Antrihabitans sp. YC2-6]
MNKDIEFSRLRISRRRALAVGGTVGLGGVLAACSGNSTSSTSTAVSAGTTSGSTVASDAVSLLDAAPQCVLSKEETQGPYWFDVDSIRSDIREDRPGLQFDLALRVQDVGDCTSGGIANAVVEIWHCDAGGSYSGFESGSSGNGGPPGRPGSAGSGETSDGTYSVGDQEATTTDDGTYLRGAQTTDAAGIVAFTTIFPGWYMGRAVHIHLKVHIDKKTVLTSQLFFDPTTVGEIYANSPYSDHAGWASNVQNSNDNIYDPTGLVTLAKGPNGYLGAINLGVDV